ncbi:MAG: Do family serine endopeptidase [Nitrospinota bacterium]
MIVPRRPIGYFTLAVGILVLGWLWAGNRLTPSPESQTAVAASAETAVSPPRRAVVPSNRGSFAPLVKGMKPAVVNISTIGQSQAVPRGVKEPFEEFFERFFGGRPEELPPQRSLGSGFILDKNGYILTNNHVVENAQQILVRLSDEREFEARLIGRDPQTDLALIKIPAKRDIPAVRLGDSDAIEVGDWVIAIGNPFGLDQTVTAGIVSAKGRVIGAGPYDDFIQTDASINPGNSGGPLFNTQGEVIGINTAIASRTGGSVGIGFAIPVNMAKKVIAQLKGKGRVIRGWLGVSFQPLTPALRRQLGLRNLRGALVAQVIPDSPADRGGFRSGDVIVRVEENPVIRPGDLPRLVADLPIGKDEAFRVIRNGRELTLTAKIGEQPRMPRN